MRIIGNGFVAGHLTTALGDRHPHATVVAAGVSSTSVTDPALFDREAALLYRTLAECRAAGHRLVFLSTASFAMYGYPDAPAAEDDPVEPPVTYGRHKLALETVVRASGVEHLILRLSHVIGAGQREHQLLPAMVAQILGGTVTVLSGAHRDLLDVRDLVTVLDALLTAGVHGTVVNVASGVPQPIESIVDGIERRMGTTAARTHRPGPVARTPVDIGRLHALVPGAVRPGGYLDRVLDAHLPSYTTRLAART